SALIHGWLTLGIGPKGWADGATLREKARIYLDYSTRETFYRGYATIRNSFTAAGFFVTPQSLQLQHPRIDSLNRRIGRRCLRAAVERALMEFRTGELLMQRRGVDDG